VAATSRFRNLRHGGWRIAGVRVLTPECVGAKCTAPQANVVCNLTQGKDARSAVGNKTTTASTLDRVWRPEIRLWATSTSGRAALPGHEQQRGAGHKAFRPHRTARTHLRRSPSDVKRLRRTLARRTMHSRAVEDRGGWQEEYRSRKSWGRGRERRTRR
jgi:hypothetical protein